MVNTILLDGAQLGQFVIGQDVLGAQSPITVVESLQVTLLVSLNDADTINAADTFTTSIASPYNDSDRVVGTETFSIFTTYSRSDSDTITSIETSIHTKFTTRTDTDTITVVETVSITQSRSYTDSGLIGSMDILTASQAVPYSDVVPLNETESFSMYQESTITDSNSVTVTESMSIYQQQMLTDGDTIAVTGALSFEESDSAAFTDEDIVSVSETPLDVVAGIHIHDGANVEETATLGDFVLGVDVLGAANHVGLQEQMQGVSTLSFSDGTTLGVADIYVGGGQQGVTLVDNSATIVSTEQMAVSIATPYVDLLSLRVDEFFTTDDIDFEPRSDTLAFQVVEEFNVMSLMRVQQEAPILYDLVQNTNTVVETSHNNDHQDDIRKRSKSIHHAAHKLLDGHLTILYKHEGIFNVDQDDTTEFLVLDDNRRPRAAGIAITDWESGEIHTDISKDVRQYPELLISFGIDPFEKD